MTRKMGPWLTGAAVHAMGDRYDGIIAAVEEQEVRNRWTTRTSLEDVVVFGDGKRLVLSHGMRLELIARFGSESNDWLGQPISLGTRAAERKGQVSWERFLYPPDETVSAVDALDDGVGEPVDFLDDQELQHSVGYRFSRRRN
jgi:hypothetical protein